MAERSEVLSAGKPKSYGGESHEEGGSYGGQVKDVADSLIGRIRQEQQASNGMFEFGGRSLNVFCNSLGCTVLSLMLLILPITMIVVGAIYLHDCGVQRYIPIYLIVGGSFGVVSAMRYVVRSLAKEDYQDPQNCDPKDFMAYGWLVDMFLFAWLICGSVWVYSIYRTVVFDPPESPHYCQKTVYMFSFGLITAYWSLIGLFAVVSCCFCCCFSLLLPTAS